MWNRLKYLLFLLAVVLVSIGVAWALPAPANNLSLLELAIRLYLPVILR
jgi:hypothetical protein